MREEELLKLKKKVCTLVKNTVEWDVRPLKEEVQGFGLTVRKYVDTFRKMAQNKEITLHDGVNVFEFNDEDILDHPKESKMWSGTHLWKKVQWCKRSSRLMTNSQWQQVLSLMLLTCLGNRNHSGNSKGGNKDFAKNSHLNILFKFIKRHLKARPVRVYYMCMPALSHHKTETLAHMH